MKMQKGTLGRVMKIVMSKYAVQFIIVILCIGIATYCTLQGTLFMQQLIDRYIMPMLSGTIDTNTGFSELSQALLRLAITLLIGVAVSYTYNRIMINVSQGSLLDIRKQIFSTMEKLPISYFDTHSHGDIM
ncbi:MAG: ABC transporter ATP-binding protein, partial [Clostridia bacterium]|nr:ABC transporter ATP-binding protein [Clostridia bacterium]